MLDIQSAEPSWQPLLKDFFDSPEGKKLDAYLDARRKAGAVIFPPTPFRALTLTPADAVRVVIVGQDPYHEQGQAQGLAFSVQKGVKVPPSLRNIYKEIALEFGSDIPSDGDLSGWASQGVLLLNAVLTVEEGAAGSHAKKGWEILTDRIIRTLADKAPPKAFLLWGGYAQKKKELIEASGIPHLVLCSNHPSPLSARRGPVPFIGCGHFAKVNDWLLSEGEKPVDWTKSGL